MSVGVDAVIFARTIGIRHGHLKPEQLPMQMLGNLIEMNLSAFYGGRRALVAL
jgi:hypothetical protein